MREPAWRRYRRFWGPDVRSDVDDELAFHVELRVDQLVAAGMDPQAARREAVRRLGVPGELANTIRVISGERLTNERRREWMHGTCTELKVAARQLLRYPVLATVAVLTLALGLGATTAIFDVLHAVLLRPLPYADADRIVRITETFRAGPASVGPGQYTEWVARAQAFDVIGAYLPTTFNLTDGTPERVPAAFGTSGFFRARYVAPLHGRYVLPEEERAGRDRVVVLSEGLFRRRYAGDSSVVGKVVRLNGEAYTVIGVAPAELGLASPTDQLWVPLALTARHKATFGDHWLLVYAKRKAGVNLAQAQRDMERVSREIAQLHPDDMVDRSARVLDFRSDLVADHERSLTVLFGAVGVVLLLACLNVTNLLLARATVRRKETAIRAALGATRGHIVRHHLMESLVLAGSGALLAVIVSRVTSRILVRLAPSEIPGLDHAGQGPAGVVFLAAVSLLVAVVLGVMPAFRGLRLVAPSLRGGGRSTTETTSRDRLRGALVVCEVALAVALLTGAGLFVKSARALMNVDPGFDTKNLLTARVSLPSSRYPNPERVRRTYLNLVDAIARLPHVVSASANSAPQLTGGAPGVDLDVEGQTYAIGDAPSADFHIVVPGYFAAIRAPILAGRAFGPADDAHAPPVVMISETLAKQIWPNASAVGKRIACCEEDSVRSWREVVGVVADTRQFLRQDPLAEIYMPIEQAPAATATWLANSMAFVVRTDGNTASVWRGVRQTIAAADPTLPVYDVLTYGDLTNRASAADRFSTVLFSALAGLALLLAAVGLYGVLAFSVAQRTFEMALRVALGARPTDVLALVTRQGMKLVLIGLVIGLGLGVAGSRAIASLLFRVAATDPITCVASAVMLIVVGVSACYVPARRASSVDPATTLRA
jgi:predicted permease